MIEKPIYYYILTWLVFFAIDGHAQEPFAWSITEDDGLPSSEIYGIFEANDGHIWIGTDGGIVRYNGLKIQKISPLTSSGTSFANFKQGSGDTIWFSNFNKQLFYSNGNWVKELMFPYKLTKDFDYYFNDNFLYIYTDSLLEYNLTNHNWNSFPVPNNQLGFSFNDYSSNNKILSSYQGKLWSLNGNSIEYFGKLQKPKKNQYRFFIECIELDLNKYFLRYGNALFWGDKASILNSENNFITTVESNIYKTIIDNQNNVWLITSNGAYFFKRENDSFASPELFFQDYQISAFEHDREGNYWFGTLHHGVFVVPDINVSVYTDKNSKIPDTEVNVIETAKEHFLLLGHSNGMVSKFNTLSKKIIEVFDTETYDNVINIHYHSKWDEILIAFPCLYSFKWDNNKIKKECKEFCFDNLAILDDDYVFTGLRSGLNFQTLPFLLKKDYNSTYFNLYDPIKKDTINCSETLIREKLSNERVYDLVFDPIIKNKLWVAFNNRLCTFHQGKISEIKDKNNASIVAKSLFVDNNTLWVGTINKGLIKIKDEKHIVSLDMKNGMSSNYCHAICNQDSFLWVASFDGLSRINKNTYKIEVLNTLDGLISNKIKDVFYQDNKIWIATSKGLIEVPENINLTNNTGPIIKLNLPSVKNVPYKDSINIFDYKKNDIRFSFQAIAIKSKGSFTYEYRLLGIDSSWSSLPGSTNFVRFQGLKYGRYVFQVRAKNEDGVLSISRPEYAFEILPAYWQTWWFVILVVLFIILIVSIIIILKYQNLRASERLKNSVQKLKMRALQAQMNPHFVFNSMTAIQSYWMAHERKKALIYHAQFAKLMRLIFQYSQESSISIQKEIEFLKVYLSLEEIRFENQVDCHFNIDPELRESNLNIPPLLIQPIVENAFKHGFLHIKEKGKLKIILKTIDRYIYCSIEDNGNGINKDIALKDWNTKENKRKSSQEVTIERLEMLRSLYKIKNNKELFVLSNLNDLDKNLTGLKVELFIPCY